MKKTNFVRIMLCAALILALLCTGAMAEGAQYTAATKGFGGEIQVTLTMDGETIVDVKAEGAQETVGIGSRAIESLPAAIVEAQSAEVEAVAGATVTSKAIMLAAQTAIDAAKGVEVSDEQSFAAGTYTGSATGFGGEIQVEVAVDEKNILSVTVLAHDETPGIGSTAIDLLPARIVEAQSLGIDTIAGCTSSSSAVFTAVENALAGAGANMALLKKAPEAKAPSTEVVAISKDIVVIGAGAAGKIASLAADEKGADVLLLEKMSFIGGAAAISGGHVISTGSNHQKNGGVTTDTPDVLYNDLIEGGHHLNDPFMARILADNIGEAFDWLNDYVGVQFEDTPNPNASHSQDRDFYHPNQSAGINADIKAKIFERGYDVLLDTRAYELKMDENGAVVGVMAKGADGTTYDITAKAVILATGGFGNNHDMLTEELKNVLYYGPVSATGDGHIMAEAVNAKFQKMELGKVRGNGVKVAEGLSKSTTNGNKAAVRNGSGILVSREGVRVVNENGTNDSVTKTLMAQPDGILFFVMDQASYDLFHAANKKANVVSDEQARIWLESDIEYPIYVSGATLEEAAQKAGVDAQALVKTVEHYNELVRAGEDTDFGRNVLNAEFGEGPYYIVEQRARFASTLGGLVTNANMQVLDVNDQVIPGLYAAGEIVGGAHGDDALPGCNLGWAYTTGRIAAYTAAQEAAE